MVWQLNKKVCKIDKFSGLHITLFLLKFVWIVFVEIIFVGTVFVASIISLHVIIESCIIFSKHLHFSKAHVLGFQI